MKRAVFLATHLAVAGFVLAAAGVNADETKPDGSKSGLKPSAPTIVGAWCAAAASISAEDGSRKMIDGAGEFGGAHLVNAIISEKAFTLRVGEKILADMAYTLDPKQNPCAIDLNTPNGPLLGIYKLNGDRLRIRLADAAMGRPKSFGRKTRSLDLLLRREEGTPLMVADADGGNQRKLEWTSEVVLCDSPALSPDGRKIAFDAAYPLFRDSGSKIFVIDLKTKQRRLLLDKDYVLDKEFGYIGQGFGWSPDGRWICFKASSVNGEPDEEEVAVVHVDGQKKGFRVLVPSPAVPGIKSVGNCFAWDPKDGKRILTSLCREDDDRGHLYLLDAEGKAPPQRLAGQDPANSYAEVAWSPDGKRIVFSAHPRPTTGW